MSTEQLPRETSAWSPTNHLGDRVRKGDRFLDGDVIRACIEDGVYRTHSDGRVAAEQWVDGVHYRLVLEPETREVITGYPQGIDEQAALEAGRTAGQIEAIRERIKRKRSDR